MPSNKNAVSRYKYLDELLSDKYHYYDIHDLTSLCNERLKIDGQQEVSQRTIEMDLRYLENAPFYAEIERIKKNGKSCIKYKDQAFSIFTKKLSIDEENLLSEVLNTLGQFDGLDNFEWMGGLREKLGIKPHDKVISFSKNQYLTNSNMLGGLFTAISNKQVIAIDYHTFKNPLKRSIALHPYLLKQYNDRWYLIGCTDTDDCILTYALDRIDSFEILPMKEFKEPECDIEERYDDVVGITVSDNMRTEKVLIWISEQEYDYLHTKPIHGSQRVIKGEDEEKLRKEYPSLEGGFFVEYEVKLNYEFTHILISYGDELVVLKPTHLYKSIKQSIEKQLERYSSVRK